MSFHHPWAAAPTPGDPRPPAERRRSIVFGCDIDHTLINQAHAVLPRVMGGWYPEPFPPWPAQSPPPNAILQSDALMRYIMANKKTLHITNFSDNNKSWPESARVRRGPAGVCRPLSPAPRPRAARCALIHRACHAPRSPTHHHDSHIQQEYGGLGRARLYERSKVAPGMVGGGVVQQHSVRRMQTCGECCRR